MLPLSELHLCQMIKICIKITTSLLYILLSSVLILKCTVCTMCAMYPTMVKPREIKKCIQRNGMCHFRRESDREQGSPQNLTKHNMNKTLKHYLTVNISTRLTSDRNSLASIQKNVTIPPIYILCFIFVIHCDV